MQVGCQAQDGHDFAGHGNVKTVFPGNAVGFSPKADDDVAQGPVIHIYHALPNDPPGIDVQGIPLLDGVVKHGGQQHMGRSDGMEVSRKMKVDIFHGDHLGITAAGSAALNAETGPQRRLAQCYDNLFPDLLQALGQANCCGGFAFTGRCGRDGRNQHQFPRFPLFYFTDQVIGKFCFILSVQFQVILINS